MSEEQAEWFTRFNPFCAFDEHVSSAGPSMGKTMSCEMDQITSFFVKNWPLVRGWLSSFARQITRVFVIFLKSSQRGLVSSLRLGSAAYFLLLWCSFLSITGMSCLLYVLLGSVIICLAGPLIGLASMISVIGILGATLLWIYGSIWLTSIMLLIAGGISRLKHTKLALCIATVYSMYCAKVSGGWFGLVLCMILACTSNDIFIYLSSAIPSEEELKSESWNYEHSKKGKSSDTSENSDFEGGQSENSERKSSGSSGNSDFECGQSKNTESKPSKLKSEEIHLEQNSDEPSTKDDMASASVSAEVQHILSSSDYYEMLGFARYQTIDNALLKRVYRKKAILVHPDKNMGSSLAEESFKKLQVAYEILLDSAKKNHYDEQLRKEEFKRRQQSLQRSTQNSVSCSLNRHPPSFHVSTTFRRRQFMDEEIRRTYSYGYGNFGTNMEDYTMEEEFLVAVQNFMARGDFKFPGFVFDNFERHRTFSGKNRKFP
eukprot:TRINITY_DN2489_c0_g1_i1.p1 TRINITY_DN2489_c0_g1~~TRINITY_DN2489_c0_g1_i1.p1  ORF type:complete len:488 (-),score=88.41 TRINITY_DN2489_c0_g1_i1:159-1622(-)